MFKIIKLALFAALILVVANLVTVKGKTLSDQVKAQISHAERQPSVQKIKKWISPKAEINPTEVNGVEPDDTDQIKTSERQKLRSLITELNRSDR